MNVVTLTNLYPSAARPAHGLFVEQRMTRYAARFGATLRVVAPVPWFPVKRGFGRYSAFARTPRAEERKGVRVVHPRVLLLPRVGMTFAPAAWVRACKPILQALHADCAIDVLDAHYLYPDAVAAAVLSRQLRLPLVVSARGSDVNILGEMPGPRARIIAAAAQAEAVIAVSGALGEKLASMGVAREKIHVVVNGVDVDRFAPAGAPPPLAPGRVLLGVGRVVRGKGFHIALGALAALRAEYSDLHLVIAGEGPERARLTELAARLHLSDRLHWLGEVPHERVPSLLWAAHRFLLSSLHEGYPNVVVEAIAAGCPVVATPVGGVPDIVAEAFGDLAARADDVGALAAALRRSLERKFQRGAFDRQRANLRWEPILDRLHVVLSAAAGAKR